MSDDWALEVDRTDLSRTALVEVDRPDPAEGEALLRVDRVGLTANNVTYALLGDAFRYWEFFPATEGWGRVPLWGFAEVVASRAPGVEVGQRLYGYLPPAGSLLVQPTRVDERGFRDASAHRAALPSPYNAYALTTGDPAYEASREDLQVLYRPLFYTSVMLADSLVDAGMHGARTVVMSSASSKTAYGAAFLLRGGDAEVVGLTSPGNVAFTESLGCYDRVLPYDAVDALDPASPTVYVDLAGSAPVRQSLHDHLDALVLDLIVGVTHQDAERAGTLTVRPTGFFAPDQMAKRTRDWGREGLDQHFAQAWARFVPVVEQWVDVLVSHGPEGLRAAWLEVQGGASAPRTGHVVQL